MSTELEQVNHDIRVANPLELLNRMVEKNIDPDALGKMMALAERWAENQSKKDFADALTAFQAEMPQIYKGRVAKGKDDAKMSFNYASLDDIMHIAGPLLAKHRIVVTFDTDSSVTAQMKATCRVRVGTHSESTSVMVPIPPGKVTATQLFGQAISYAKRYALCAALNIIVTDEDNDGGGGPLEGLNDEQVIRINELIDDCRESGNAVHMQKFYAWIAEKQKTDVEGLKDVYGNQFADIVGFLEKKKREALATKGKK